MSFPDAFQLAYAVALIALTYPAWRSGNGRIVAVIWANMAAIFAVAGAWDVGLIGDEARFRFYMTVDLASGAALIIRPGLSRVVAIGYAATFPFYIPLVSGFFTEQSPPIGVILAQSALQLGALGIGICGGHGGSGGGRNRSRRGLRHDIHSLAQARRGGPVLPGHVSQHSGEVREIG